MTCTVLHFAGTINRYDFIDMVIRFADPSRFRMIACTFRPSNIEPPDYLGTGTPHFTLPIRGRESYPAAVFQLARILRREHVDILHTHHYDEAVIGALAARIARTPALIIGRHYHDEIYLTTRHLRTRFFVGAEQFANRYAKAIIVPSAAIRELLVQRQEVPGDKVTVIPYGFDFQADRYKVPSSEVCDEVRREFSLDKSFVIGNFARQNTLKGQEYLVRAFAQLHKEMPSSRLLMVGDGATHEALRELAGELGLVSNGKSTTAKVLFAGWRKDARRIMSAVDVVVHPTLLDSFPQVMIEAMALARPLITTPAAGPADQVKDKVTGMIVPMRDSDAIYRALCWTREHSAEAELLGRRAREYVLSNLDIRQVVQSYEAVYQQVAPQRG